MGINGIEASPVYSDVFNEIVLFVNAFAVQTFSSSPTDIKVTEDTEFARLNQRNEVATTPFSLW